MKYQLLRFIAFIFIYCLWVRIPFAQSPELDQLKYQLQKAEEDTAKVHLILQICGEISNPDEQLYYARRAVKLADQLEFSSGYALSKFEEGKALLTKGQTSEALESFQQSLNISKKIYNTQLESKSMLYIGQCFEFVNDVDSAIYYYDSALKLSEELGYRATASEAYYFTGNIYNDIGDNEKALEYVKKAFDFYENSENSEKLWYALNSLGVIYDDIGNYPEALKCYIDALEIIRTLNDTEGQVMVLNNIASFYYQIGKLDESLKFYDEALELFIGVKNPSEEWFLLNNKAQIFIEQGDTLSALIHLKKAYQIVSAFDDECNLVYVLDGIATIMRGQSKTDSALVNYQRALDIALKCNNQLLTAILSRGIGETYHDMGKYQKSERFLLKSMDICDESNYPREKEKSSFQLYRLFKTRGNASKALEYHEIYSGTKDSLFNNNSNMEVSRISSEYEFKKELHKMEYKKQAEEMRLIAELDKEASNKNVLLLVLILTVLLAATLVRSYFLLQSHNKRLESLNEEKNTLMGVVAHDLRSPLNNIKGLISLMRSDPGFDKTSEENQKYFTLLSESTNHMREMIDKALDINAIEEMKLNLSIEKCDVAKILSGVLANFQFLAGQKNIRLIFDFEPNKFFANIDRNYTIQIFDNLLSNAIKFSQPQTRVLLKIEREEEWVKISVKDEGPGLSDEDRLKLFNKYQKLGAKPTANEESIGLGLSIVKKFVDAMKGEITCVSHLGKGSTFTVKFKSS